jgi:hypothetical protein
VSSERPYDPNSANAAASSTNPANSGTRPSPADQASKDREAGAAGTTQSLSDFRTYDKDRDGRLSLQEFLLTSGISSIPSDQAAPARGTGDRGSPGSSRSPTASTGSASDPMHSSTPAGSPALRESENSVKEGAELSIRQMFRRLDADHDSYVTPAELETYRRNNSTPPPR